MSDGAARVELVQSMYQRLGSGDVAGARTMWADDAVWHLTGTHDRARDYSPEEYFGLLGEWMAAHPSYQSEFVETRDLGEDMAMIVMESTGGSAPGTASGVLLYRVIDSKITEGWAIPTFAAGAYAF
jgi:predicted SnoaL-like aldol condensation-catalyzing enzyme